MQPVLTRSLALCLRQSCLKAWERSMAQLPRAVKRRTKRSEEAPVELLGELAELNLHRNTMSSRRLTSRDVDVMLCFHLKSFKCRNEHFVMVRWYSFMECGEFT